MFSISCLEGPTCLTNIVIGTVPNMKKHTSTGVYKLKCNDCPNYYIGQTGRSFKTQYTEHIKALTQPHTTPYMKNTHPQVFTNLNVPITILVKQVDPSKHDILNI